MNNDLRQAIVKLRATTGRTDCTALLMSERGARLTPASIVNWFATTYAAIGLDGCTSHSGRRTFITNASRTIAKVGGSLIDVQELAGHSGLSMTQRCIEGNRRIQRRIIDRI